MAEQFKIPNAHAFVISPLQSGKGFVTIIIAGLFVTIPSSYLSIVKNFGIGILLGAPVLTSLIVFANTGTVTLEGELLRQLQDIITELDRVLLQLNSFVDHFHSFVNKSGINVITDASGSLGIDVSVSVDDITAQNYANRINVIDGLINNHIHNIESLLHRGSYLENQIRELNSDYVSQLDSYRERLRLLINRYGHIN